MRGRQRHAIIATFRYTGARAGEVSGLRLDRIDLPGRRLESLGKGSRHGTIALTSQLAGVLGTFLGDVRPLLPETPYLFVNTHPNVSDPSMKPPRSSPEDSIRRSGMGADPPLRIASRSAHRGWPP